MPFIISKEYPYGLIIYVRWDSSGSGSYWAWTDDRKRAERFHSRDSQQFQHAFAAASKDRWEVKVIEEE